MTNPQLSFIAVRHAMLCACAALTGGCMLVLAGRPLWAAGLVAGLLTASANTLLTIWRVERASRHAPAAAARVMSQGMLIRFAMVALVTITLLKFDIALIAGFVPGLITGLALAITVAVRAFSLGGPASPAYGNYGATTSNMPVPAVTSGEALVSTLATIRRQHTMPAGAVSGWPHPTPVQATSRKRGEQ